jgi:ubiquinone/menaquinone biosynthesis C-methylase UbiE
VRDVLEAPPYPDRVSADDYEGLERFADIDATGEEAMFVSFLAQIERLPDVVARRQRSYELLDLSEGELVADVGCGLGTAARELAARGARVIGFDVSEAMLAEARRRSGVRDVEYKLADAAELPLEDGELAAYRAERVYQHVADPAAALAEARRVLALDGRIVLVDQDWDGLLIDGEPRELTRAALRGHADSFRNPWIGRSYRRLLTEAGFADITVYADLVPVTTPPLAELMPKLVVDAAVDAGTIDGDEAARWHAEQRARLEAGTFFAAMTHVIAAARRRS